MWRRSAIRIRFSSPVRNLSTAENWPVTPIAARTASGSPAQVVPANLDLASIGADHGREDLDRGRLPGTIGAEQREDGARGDVEVDAVQHDLLAVGLAQPGHAGSRRAGCCSSCVASSSRGFRARQTRGSPCRGSQCSCGSIDRRAGGQSGAEGRPRRRSRAPPRASEAVIGPGARPRCRGSSTEAVAADRPRSRRAGAGSVRASARASRTPRASTHPS